LRSSRLPSRLNAQARHFEIILSCRCSHSRCLDCAPANTDLSRTF
jgi:hypothetical protein